MTEKLQLSDALDRAKDSSYLSLFTFLRTDVCGNELTARKACGASTNMWYFKLPGAVYANGPIEVNNEQEARQFVRELLDVKRVPNGTEFWRKGR